MIELMDAAARLNMDWQPCRGLGANLNFNSTTTITHFNSHKHHHYILSYNRIFHTSFLLLPIKQNQT